MQIGIIIALAVFLGLYSSPVLAMEPWERELVLDARTVFESGFRAPSDYKPQSNFDPSLVPLRILRAWDQLGPEARNEISKVIEPAFEGGKVHFRYPQSSSLEKSFTSEHFTVWYTDDQESEDAVAPRDDSPADGTPDFINRISETFEDCYDYEINEMGFENPIAAGELYRVNVRNLEFNYYGFTSPMTCDTQTDTCTTFITMDNDYSFVYPYYILDAIRVTAAHEFFHAVQFGSYRIWQSSHGYGHSGNDWIIEATAVWMEDMVYPSINDYTSLYLPRWFQCPEVSLDAVDSACDSTHIYGDVVFFRFLSEKVGGRDSVRTIWELLRDRKMDALPGVIEYLASLGANLRETFHGFAVANYVKDYIDGALFPDMSLSADIDSMPGAVSGSIDHLAANYIAVSLPSDQVTTLTVNAGVQTDMDVTVLARDDSGLWHQNRMSFQSGWGTVQIPGAGVRYGSLVLVVTNGNQTQDELDYHIDLSVETAVADVVTLQAHENWVLVSFPITPKESTPQDVLELSDPQIYWFENGAYLEETDPDFPGFKILGKGMWIHFDNSFLPYSHPVDGLLNTDPQTVVELARGWNIIGNPYNAAVPYGANIRFREPGGGLLKSPSEAQAAGWLEAALWGFGNEEYFELTPAQSLEPMRGYWLFTFADLEMVVTKP